MQRRPVAVVLVLALLAAMLSVTFPKISAANHGGRVLEVWPEVASTTTGSLHTLTATLSSAADTPVFVDFEVETGPSNPDGNTPATPDYTCTVAIDEAECTVDITSAIVGTQIIRAWIDHDANGPITEADPGEGRYSGEYVNEETPPSAGDCTDDDPSTNDLSCQDPGNDVPGNTSEPDLTDVVSVTWTTTAALLNCGPENAVRPNTGPDSSVAYSCTAQDSSGNPVSGVLVDGENMDGANDPDDAAAGSADYDDFCNGADWDPILGSPPGTNANGVCSGTIPASEGQQGPADICFWADINEDDAFGSDQADGGDCALEVVAEAENNDSTDKVRVTWQPCSPYDEPSFATDLARDVEMYNNCSGFILDGFGGVHPVGDAEAVVGLPYFPNFDIARELVIVYDQTDTPTGGFVLDGWGGMHPFRTADGTTPAAIQGLPYFPGNDIARDAVLTGFNQTLGSYTGYMLDGRGGIHPFGGNDAVTPAPPYFNSDIARELVLPEPATESSPGYILDGYGGMHPINEAPALTGLPYFEGNDIANDALLTSEPDSGYMLDGYGGIHPFGAAPAVENSAPYTSGFDNYRAFDLSNSTIGVVLDRSGKLWDFLLPPA